MKPSMYVRVLEAQSRRGTPEGDAAYDALIAELLAETE
jgi:hypothetical protein